eukprot:13595271-Alexandrium_andersonii.AAC.1
MYQHGRTTTTDPPLGSLALHGTTLPRDMMRHLSCYGITRCAAPCGAKRYNMTWVVMRGAAMPNLPRDAS